MMVEITPGSDYTIPGYGYYVIGCYNEDPNHVHSASISLNGANLLINSQSFTLSTLLPIKAGAVLSTRANTSGSTDNFHYVIISRFV